jgi:hypothetical protein
MATHRHLEPLLDGTPLAMERLKVAWPGLSTSDRAFLLTVLLADSSKEQRAIRWSHHKRHLMDLALADRDPYIRYLAAKHVSAPFKIEGSDETPDYIADKLRFEKVKSDSSMRSARSADNCWRLSTGNPRHWRMAFSRCRARSADLSFSGLSLSSRPITTSNFNAGPAAESARAKCLSLRRSRRLWETTPTGPFGTATNPLESPRVQWRLSSVSPTVSVLPDSVQ